MIIRVRNNSHTLDYFELIDCNYIQKLLAYQGINLTLQEVADIWDRHSANRCAVWLELPNRGIDLINIVLSELSRNK